MYIKTIIYLLIVVFLLSFRGYSKENPKVEPDIIYFGGDIVTMEGDSPQYVESIGMKDGKIIFVGSKNEVMKIYGEKTKLIDLQGKTLLPGFIDAHGHLWNAGFQALSANLLSPPDGKGKDITSLIKILDEWKDNNENAISKYGWIIGFGYDDSQLMEKRHPTADELDKVSKDYPVIIIHQSGHLAVMNHKALELSSYNEITIDPPGGIIRRKEGSQKPNGVLEEMAFFTPIFKLMATLDQQANEKIAFAGLDAYMRFGFTTSQEGRATKDVTETWEKLSKLEKLPIDVACYPDIQSQLELMKSRGVQKEYRNHFRIAGVKLSLDGSPQGKTAWLTKPYIVPPPGYDQDYSGYPAIEDENVAISLVDSAFANNWQILVHCNGDAAIDQFVKAVRHATNLFGNNDRRPACIHAQTTRMDQLDSFKILGIIPSFFGMHTYYWGDWHRDETLGKDRAYFISPAQTTLEKGMIFTEHHDAPVALPNSMMILYSVVNRISRSGNIIGPGERISTYDAIRSITTWAAYQYFEEDLKGTLKEGKLADLVILDKNPLKVNPMEIMDIVVLETIKEGKSVYKRK